MDNKKKYQDRARSLISPGMSPTQSEKSRLSAVEAEKNRQSFYTSASTPQPKTASPKVAPQVKPAAKPQTSAYQRPDLSSQRSRAQQLLGAGFVDAGGNGTSNMIFINPTTGETARNQLARERGASQANALVDKLASPSNPRRSTQAGMYTPDVRNEASADFFRRSAGALQNQRAAADQAAAKGMQSALARDEYMRYFTPEGDTEKRKTRAFQEMMMNPKFNERVMAKRADRTAMLQDRERFKNARRDILRFMNTGYVPAGEQGQNLVAGQAARVNPFGAAQMQQEAALRQQEMQMQQDARAMEVNLRQRGLDADMARAVAQQKLAQDSLALRSKETEAGIESQKLRDRLATEELGANIDEKAYEAEQAAYERSPEGYASQVTGNLIEQGVPPAAAMAMARNPMGPDATATSPDSIKSEYETFLASGLPQTPEGFQTYLNSRGLFFNPSDVKRTLEAENFRNDPFNTDWTLGDPIRSMLGYKTTKENEDMNNRIIQFLIGAPSRQVAPQPQSQPTQNPSKARAEALRKRSELLRELAQ